MGCWFSKASFNARDGYPPPFDGATLQHCDRLGSVDSYFWALIFYYLLQSEKFKDYAQVFFDYRDTDSVFSRAIYLLLAHPTYSWPE
jgi:hypothetical protein